MAQIIAKEMKMTKTYDIYHQEEIIDTIYCYSLENANELAEEIYPDINIYVEEA